MTQITYFRLRRRLLAHGVILPAEKNYREGAARFRPKFEHFSLKEGEEPIGVKANFLGCLEHTFREIMEGVEKKNPQFQTEGGEPRKLYATVKYGEHENQSRFQVISPNVTSFAGLDGSGSHREIGRSKVTNVISVMFGASNIREFSDGEDIWSAADEKGHSSPR